MKEERVGQEYLEEKIIVLADLSGGVAPPLPISVPNKIFGRFQEILQKKNLSTTQIAAGVVVVGAVITGGLVLKRRMEKRYEDDFVELSPEKQREFDGLIDSYLPDVYSLLRFGLQGEERVAEELTQDVYLNAFRRYDKFIPKEGIDNPGRAWLFTIAMNTLKNEYRRKGNRVVEQGVGLQEEDNRMYMDVLPDFVLNQVHSLEAVVDIEPDLMSLRQAIPELPWNRQLLIYLKGMDFTTEEIANVFGSTPGAVKSLYNRTTEQLRKIMASPS